MPAGQPWQKGGRVLAPAPDRLTMAQLSVDDAIKRSQLDFLAQRLIVSDVDVRRPGPTYTVDTLIDVRREEPPAKWWFIVGADALAKLPSWHQSDRMGGLARFAVCPRPGVALEELAQVSTQMASAGAPIEVDHVDMPAIDVSSSLIRDLVARGESIQDLVTDSVSDYIDTHGLYQDLKVGQ